MILYGEIRCQSLFGKLEGNRDQNQHEIGIPKDVKSGHYLKAVTYQGGVWDFRIETIKMNEWVIAVENICK